MPCSVFGAEKSIQDDVQAKVLLLIKQLGSPEFSAREEAVEKILGIGFPALETIRKHGVHHYDLEIQLRSRALQRRLLADHREQFIKEFVHGENDGSVVGFFSWKPFQSLVGDSTETRKLYMQLRRDEAALINAYEREPLRANHLMLLALPQLTRFTNVKGDKFPINKLIVVLFVANNPKVTLGPRYHRALEQVYSRMNFPKDKASSTKILAVKKLLGGLLSREDIPIGKRLLLGQKHKLPEALVLAEQVLAKGSVSIRFHELALDIFAKLGDESHLPILEKSLNNQTVLRHSHHQRKLYKIQLGDEVLAVLIHMTKQKHAEYGYTVFQPNNTVFRTTAMGFATEELRSEAKKKWKAYRQKNGKQIMQVERPK